MLDVIPPEIIGQILGHLPTASAIINVAFTNRKLYEIVSANDYGVFRVFVQKSFPSIVTPPLWRDMAYALTSRSRAWEKRSFVARECYDPQASIDFVARAANNQFGYVPVIDSYGMWTGNDGCDYKEVVAFGTAGRLRLRIREKHRIEWKSSQQEDDHLARNDILELRLLKPNQHTNIHGESVILRKANGEIVRLDSGPGKDNITQVSRFIVDSSQIDCMDVGACPNASIAVCSLGSLRLFQINDTQEIIKPLVTATLAPEFQYNHRKRCIKFLDDHLLATGIQFVEGRERSPILVYDINTLNSKSASTRFPLAPLSTVGVDNIIKGRHCANVIANLDNVDSLACRPGQVFLSGWTDGIARLHDLRTPFQVVSEYVDHVDDGQILSLATVGHERFYAGSHQNACLKCFDLRMPGSGRVYSHLDVLQQQASTGTEPSVKAQVNSTARQQRRNINIFFAMPTHRGRLWNPLSVQTVSAPQSRYRGAIYSLSAPCPSSPTLYVGIENHVIQLDFVNSDDILKQRGINNTSATTTVRSPPQDPSTPDIARELTDPNSMHSILSLSCYERPRDDHAATDTVLLRKQVPWKTVFDGIDESQFGLAEQGWDERWRLPLASSSARAPQREPRNSFRGGRGNRWGRGIAHRSRA